MYVNNEIGTIQPIEYISQLDELDTSNVEPTYQVFEMENVWRKDEILPQDASRDELLALTKEEKDNQIKVTNLKENTNYTFDVKFEVRISTFAVPYIMGEIKRY